MKLLGSRQSSEGPSPSDRLSLNQVLCERTIGGMLRVPETAGSCPHLER